MNLTIPPVAVVASAGTLAWVAARVFASSNLDWTPCIWMAACFGALGITCSVLGVASFRRAGTTVNPMKPDATTTLVASGIYRVSRNPMYLGFLLLLLGEIAWLANPVALLVAPAFVLYLNQFQIIPEENALRARFGRQYLSYVAQVRRWI